MHLTDQELESVRRWAGLTGEDLPLELEKFDNFVIDRATREEWRERSYYLQNRYWAWMTPEQRQARIDETTEEEMNDHRIKVMKSVENVDHCFMSLVNALITQESGVDGVHARSLGQSRRNRPRAMTGTSDTLKEAILKIRAVVVEMQGRAALRTATLTFNKDTIAHIMSIPEEKDDE